MVKKSIYSKSIALLISTVVSTSLFSQELKTKKEDLNNELRVEYHVLKSNKDIKEGLYSVFDNHSNKVVARGNYSNNKKIGSWLFFDFKGQLEQRYNFSKNELLFNRSNYDSNISYEFPFDISPNDTINPPVKVGGSILGFSFIRKTFPEIRQYMFSNGINQSAIKSFLNIDKEGNLLSFKTILLYDGSIFKNKIDSLSGFTNSFLPGKLNQQKVPCTLVYSTNLEVLIINTKR